MKNIKLPGSTPARLRWKRAILAVCAALLALATWRCSHTMRPFKDGDPSDFWYAACGVQIDPGRRSYCIGPVYAARDGWFPYAGRSERGARCGGSDLHRLSESQALAAFPAAVRQLEARAHLAGPNPQRGEIIDAGYRAWLAADPGRTNAHALLACIRDAWFDRYRKLDRERERVPPAILAASAVAAFVQPDGQPWAALVTILEAEDQLRVFRPYASPYSSYRTHRDDERHADRCWKTSQHWHWNAIGEFGYLFGLLLLAAWPWLHELPPWRWGLHLGLVPVLFFLPFWLGYANWTCPFFGPSGGVLYPSLVLYFPQLPAAPFDSWVWDRSPLLLFSWSYPLDSPTAWLQMDVKPAWFHRHGPGPVTMLTLGASLGLIIYGVREFRRPEREP